MTSEALAAKVKRLEQDLEKLKKDLRRCVEYPKNEFYPYFPQMVLADGKITLALSQKTLTVNANGRAVGSVNLN